MSEADLLKLENQLCFPIYLAAKEVITQYGAFLEPLDLTYTQYLVMMVMWQHTSLDMKALGKKLFLDSSTLTPLVNRLIKKGYVRKEKSEEDKRVLIISLEPAGMALKAQAQAIPRSIYNLVGLTESETRMLYTILYKIINTLSEER